MKYRYYINDVEVFPKGEWSIEYQRNEGQIFFRRIFEGELTFLDTDYGFIKGLDCEIATFDIYCGGQLDWQGQFQYPYKAKFDDDSCTVVLTPEVVDEYSCIMNNYQKKFALRPSGGGIFAQLWTCPAPGANIYTFVNRCYPLIGNGAITDDWFSTMLFWPSTLNCPTDGFQSFNIASSFMLRDDFANGDNYAAAYGTDNYITGATNRLEFVYLLENSHIRFEFGGTRCDSTREYTFKMFEDFLRNAFNAYWFFDENGDFRVEHHYYFDPAFPNSDYVVGHDLNTVRDRGGRSFTYRRNKYEYETGRMYDQEKWSWQHYEGTEGTVAHGQDFEGVPVFYGDGVGLKSDYVPGDFKEKELASPKFWADIWWGQALAGTGTADTIDCPTGFCMLDVVSDAANNKINCEVGILTGVSQANGHLSTANLQDHYHQYDRIFLDGNMNSSHILSFITAQKHKLQEAIEFPLCCDEAFDPLNRIETGLGTGEVKAAVQKAQSLEVELWHEFDCSALLCIPAGCILWDGIDDSVSITSPSFVDIVGSRTVTLNAYIYTNVALAEFTFICWETAAADDFFLAGIDPGNKQLIVRCYSNPAGGTSRYFDIPNRDFDRCITIEITKTAGVITGASIDGLGLTPHVIAQITVPTASYFGRYSLGGSPNWLDHMAIWNIKVYDTTPTLLHHWAGYPEGNLDPAWLDTIGPNNGTVNGSPATY